jgi:hypothetical protein
MGVRESWSWVHEKNLNIGHNSLTKAHHEYEQHMTKGLYMNVSYGFW